jgi:putative transposase
MLEHLISFSILRMSKVLDVSRSGFYYWLKNRHNASPRKLAHQVLDNHVKKAFVDGKERDGARRIKKALEVDKNPYNIKTISQSMKRQSLVAKAARKFKYTRDSNHTKAISSFIGH